MRRLSLAASIVLLLAFATSTAQAHALLDHAEPRVGNTVAQLPAEVTLWFTENIEPAFSTITVANVAGERIDTGNIRVNGRQMSISLRGGGAGSYRVNWRVLSVDSHKSEGNFSFQVEP